MTLRDGGDAAMLAAVPMADDPPTRRPLVELTVLDGSPRPERSDAARNRERILDAAQALFAERGIECVSMDDIADRAQVGKGTLYRRFGDRGGLALALVDARDAEFQEQFIRGAPPLGPGAPAADRILAFFAGYADLVSEHLPLHLAAQGNAPGARFRMGHYWAYHHHVRLLLAELDVALDAETLAHLLLAPFAGETFAHLTRETGVGRQRLLDGVRALLDGLD